jgi:membrane-associated phospholipid phosphatase
MWKQLMDYCSKLDQKISHYIYSKGCKQITVNYRSYLKGLEYSCHGIVWFAITSILIYLSPNNRLFAQLMVGLILDVVFVALLKAWTRRRRPQYASQDDQLMMILVDKHSFPSGHASRAIYLALFFYNHSLISLLIWFWSISVCLSRILLGRHHLADVVFGAFLGYFNYITQFTIFAPINALLMWAISVLFSVNFYNTNDFD